MRKMNADLKGSPTYSRNLSAESPSRNLLKTHTNQSINSSKSLNTSISAGRGCDFERSSTSNIANFNDVSQGNATTKLASLVQVVIERSRQAENNEESARLLAMAQVGMYFRMINEYF